MKDIIIGILLGTTLLFGSLFIHQKNKACQSDAAQASLRQQVSDLEAKVSAQSAKAENLGDRLVTSQTETAFKAGEVAKLRQAMTELPVAQTNLASAPAVAPKADSPLAGMFKSKEMRDMIRTQQKAVLGPMIEKNYAAFMEQLPPDKAATLKDLILKKSLAGADVGMALLSGENDQAKRTEMMQQVKTDENAYNDEIKQLLGDDAYTQFQAYEKTQPERMTMNSFKDQLGSSLALNPSQESQLLQAMTEERQNFKFTTDMTDKTKMLSDPSSFFTEEKLNQFQQEQQQLNDRDLLRAQSILSPDQYDSYKKFLDNQQAMQAAAMKLSAKMFAPSQSTP